MVRRPGAQLSGHSMRYYASPAAALDVVEDLLPSWGRGHAALACARAYFEAVPVDFSVFGFGLEYHLEGERIDAGIALPLSRGRGDLLHENLVELRAALGGEPDPCWAQRVLEPAQRVLMLAPLDARMIQACCLCMDGESLRARRCPDLLYLSLHDLHRLRDPTQLVWSPAIARLVASLFGEREAPGVELLERVAAARLPSVKLAHVGVARVEAGGAVKPYFSGKLEELVAMLGGLPRASGFAEAERVLQALAASAGQSQCTVLLGAGPELDRIDIEVVPGPYFARALAIARVDHGVAKARLDELQGLARAGVTRRAIDDWAPVASRLSHLKVSLKLAQAPSWKAYFVVRQAG